MSDERTTGDPNAPQHDPAPASEPVAEHEGAAQPGAADPAVDFGAPADTQVDAPAIADPQTAVAPSELAPVDTAAPGDGAPVESASVASEIESPAAGLPPAAPIAEPLAPASAVYDVPETAQPTPQWAAPAAEPAAVEPAAVEPAAAEPAAAPAAAAPAVAALAVAAVTPADLGAPAAEAVAYPTAAFQTPAPYTEAAPAPAYPPGTYPPAGYQQAPGAPGYQGYGAPAAVVVPVLTAPKKRGNRGIGILISLVGTVIYAVLFAVVAAVILAFNVSASRLGGVVGDFVSSPAYYVPVIFFAVALILVVLIVNRAGWWAYVFGGFLVAVVVYGAAILGALLAVQAWNFSSADLTTFIRSLVMDPLTLAAAIVAREVPIWIGAWIASRGRKLKAKNAADREEYERKLAETPVATYPAAPAGPAI